MVKSFYENFPNSQLPLNKIIGFFFLEFVEIIFYMTQQSYENCSLTLKLNVSFSLSLIDSRSDLQYNSFISVLFKIYYIPRGAVILYFTIALVNRLVLYF